MPKSRVVPVGNHLPTVFVRTDRVIGMDIAPSTTRRGEYHLTIHMDGMDSACAFFSSHTQATEAAHRLTTLINEDLQ